MSPASSSPPRAATFTAPALAALLCAAATLLAPGCARRTISITSEPPGALVWINDQEVGRTPVSTDFRYYGTYDVRLRLNGYEPLRTSAKADAPLYEFPPIDLAAEAAGTETRVHWHFVLQPAVESTLSGEALDSELISRANQLRSDAATPAPTGNTTAPSTP